jgi:PAS domain S-box-containing protein
MTTLGNELGALGLTCAVVLRDPDDQTLKVRYTSMESTALALAEKLGGLKLEGYRIPHGTWFVKEVVESGRAMYVSDPIAETAELVPGVPGAIVKRAGRMLGLTPDTLAIYLPLTVEERAVGALAVWGEDLRAEDVAALSVSAGQVASALENARLFQAEQRRTLELTTLLEATRAASSTLDLKEVLSVIAMQIVQAVDADGCTLSRWDQEADALLTWIERRRDLKDCNEPGMTFALEDFPASRAVLESHQPLSIGIRDSAADAAELAYMRKEGLKSLLIVPLLVGQRAIGILEVDECSRDREFTATEIRLCQALADQAAVAIENSRLYQSVRQELGERSRAEEALKEAQRELEVRVEERTADLMAANVSLRAEIAERKRVETALRESEAKYRQLVKHAPTGLYEIDLTNMRLLDVNDVMCGYSGYTREEFLELNPLDILADESRKRFLARTSLLTAGEPVPESVEYKIRTKNGQESWVLLNARFSQEKGITKATVVAHDITGRKRAEGALQESEEKHRNLFRHSNDGILLHDLEGCILDANQRALEQLGYTRSELLSINIAELHPPEALDAYRQAVEKISHEGIIRFEIPFRKKSGHEFVAEVSSSLFDLRGQRVVQAVVRDITERKRAELLLQALNQAATAMERALAPEEIFVAVAEEFRLLGFACAILLVDEDRTSLSLRYLTYETGVLLDAEELTGVRHHGFSFPVEGKELFRAVVWDRKTVLIDGRDLLQHLMPGSAKQHAGQLVEMLGMTRLVGAPLIVEDRVIGVLTVHSTDLVESDIPAVTAFAHQLAAVWRKAQLIQDLESSLDELKQTQAQLIQAQKMEAIGRLAGGVAHDFNNLLTVIQVSTQLLMQDLRPEDPLWDRAQQIREAGERASSLTRQLLRFSRREITEPQVISLGTIVSNLSHMLHRIIGEDIELVVALADDPWLVKVDPAQMEQVIVNLAVNARDAMPQGGTLSLQTTSMTLDQSSVAHLLGAGPGEYVMLAVSDTGMGMDDEVKARIFEPFFTTKDQGQGTGLGLSTVYGIIRQNGGHIWVDSEPGQGTVFEIYLPRTEEARAQDEALQLDQAPSMIRGSETILVVEDEDAVRDLAAHILRMHGYHVLAAGSGPEAIRLCMDHDAPIHLLLTDVIMPEMNGKELAKQIESQRPGLQVLFMSGYSHDVISHYRVLENGIHFLAKPFTLETLAQKVRDVLDASI